MTDINKLIDGIVNSMDEEDLEYLAIRVNARLSLSTEKECVDYEIFCTCGHSWCPACKFFGLKVY